jgi:hypothetical protein
MNQNSPKPSSAVPSRAKPSSKTLDMVLAEMLMQAGNLYKTEIQPGETKVWLKLLTGEKPQVVEDAFFEYFAHGEFFPKPANILELIRQKRAAEFASEYKPIDREATEREQASPEWQESSRRAREVLAQIAGMAKMP